MRATGGSFGASRCGAAQAASEARAKAATSRIGSTSTPILRHDGEGDHGFRHELPVLEDLALGGGEPLPEAEEPAAADEAARLRGREEVERDVCGDDGRAGGAGGRDLREGREDREVDDAGHHLVLRGGVEEDRVPGLVGAQAEPLVESHGRQCTRRAPVSQSPCNMYFTLDTWPRRGTLRQN